MQKILIIIHAPPYGSERCLSALRLATALVGHDDKPQVRVFLMSDATVLGLPNQVDGATNGLQGMVENLVS
ncbi:MAG: DsrE family protein, partial [Rhodocyclales bacterium]|nr:DsrE family protein [Rhodocyclales bacterium]